MQTIKPYIQIQSKKPWSQKAMIQRVKKLHFKSKKQKKLKRKKIAIANRETPINPQTDFT